MKRDEIKEQTEWERDEGRKKKRGKRKVYRVSVGSPANRDYYHSLDSGPGVIIPVPPCSGVEF